LGGEYVRQSLNLTVWGAAQERRKCGHRRTAFLRYCSREGLRVLKQLDVDAVRGFRNELVKDYSANSARKHLEYVPFFRFCPCSRVHSRKGTGATPRERENRSNNWCNDVT
jgi:hypothetical protein